MPVPTTLRDQTRSSEPALSSSSSSKYVFCPPLSVSTLLSFFDTPGVPPPSARVDPTVKAEEPGPPIRFWDIWKYGALAAGKSLELAGDVFSHHIYGPRRKSWGIEMTIISSLMRDAGRHSHLFDIKFIRSLMSLSGLVPLPSDALVTPVTFKVRRRNLRGILAEYDAFEDGKRELTGEWVVGKHLWRKLQTEWAANRKEQKCGENTTKNTKYTARVLLYIHGGAYYMFDATTHRLISIPLSKHVEARVFALNYRLAPETRFPGPLHDVVSAYFRLIDDLQIPPENVIIAGDSAGGGLCLALMMYLRDNGYPLPAGSMLFSPWVDLTMSCDSWDSNSQFDVVPKPRQGDVMDPITCYLGEQMEKFLTHPYASPLFGDFKGLPPMLIQAGDAEVLRDEITLLAHKATLAGVKVRHELYEDAIHVFQAYPFLDAARKSFLSCREFVKKSLRVWQSSSPKVLCGTAEKGLEEEIDNGAKVVNGDGVEVGPEEERVEVAWTREQSSDEDTDHSSLEEYPSWGHKDTEQSPWPSPPPTDDEETDGAVGWHKKSSTPPSLLPLSDDGLHPSLRLGSTTPLIEGTTSSPSNTHPIPSPSTSAKHRRTPSLQGALLSDRKSSYYRAPPISMESVERPPPPPSIRRMSHPDISSLCQSWADSGPANQTVNYKSLQLNKSNKKNPVSDLFRLTS